MHLVPFPWQDSKDDYIMNRALGRGFSDGIEVLVSHDPVERDWSEFCMKNNLS